MNGVIDGSSPTYIAAHSADVILSDIRPIKLKSEPLHAINVLLDELLYTILNAAHSLATEKLKAGLLQILPTSLGKEALLEAEVELRAYWDRTGTMSLPESEDGRSFDLPWTFELLRLKCEGYSTLNESDEDATAEARLNERLAKSGGRPPNPALVAPAALYLTAILESFCEHILTNVGRVAARDSSRTTATIQDLFTALCEDQSIYALFRTMKVHEQIESLSKIPKPARTRPFSPSDTAPSLTQIGSREPGSPIPLRLSTSRSSVAMQAKVTNPRSSFERAKSKMFNAPRASTDRERPFRGLIEEHKKSDSVLSVDTKRTLVAYDNEYGKTELADVAIQQEFDNLMLSDSTLKVSLTPDRLKTMEVYHKEKQRGNLKTASHPNVRAAASNGVHNSASETLWERTANGGYRLPDSATDRHEAGASSSTTVSAPSNKGRFRSLSGSGSFGAALLRKSSKNESRPLPPTPIEKDQVFKRHDAAPFRSKKLAANRESLDLDDVMGGSADESEDLAHVQKQRQPQTPSRVSAATRDLMDFLADGPPSMPQMNSPPFEPTKPKSSSRLQKMISKLTIGNDRNARASTIGVDFRGPLTAPSQLATSLPWKRSQPNLPIATYPVPPRPPPQPLSPPSSPIQVNAEVNAQNQPSRKPSITRKPLPCWEEKNSLPSPPGLNPTLSPPRSPSGNEKRQAQRPPEVSEGESVPLEPPKGPLSPIVPVIDSDPEKALPSNEHHSPIPRIAVNRPTSVPTTSSGTKSLLSRDDAQSLRRLMSSATTADECRLLLDVFLAKSGMSSAAPEVENPYPSPSLSFTDEPRASVTIAELERAVLGLLLGSEVDEDNWSPESAKEVAPQNIDVAGPNPNVDPDVDPADVASVPKSPMKSVSEDTPVLIASDTTVPEASVEVSA